MDKFLTPGGYFIMRGRGSIAYAADLDAARNLRDKMNRGYDFPNGVSLEHAPCRVTWATECTPAICDRWELAKQR